MRQTWRWFGPVDITSVDDMMQCGVEGVVSALHHVPVGEVWTPDEIAKRQSEIATASGDRESGLKWEVVESLVVTEDVKQQNGAVREHLANYRTSLENLARAGIEVVCYNFMPVIDWTRTDLAYRLGHGGTCMRYDHIDFAVFDIHLLERPGARGEHAHATVEAAAERFAGMSDDDKTALTRNIVAGLPGANEHLTLDEARERVAAYGDMTHETLRQHLVDFLAEVVPTAERLGIRLCCHPDDPPFPLMGLPRVMSTEADYAAVMKAVDSPANGITLCSGSLGARADNDLPGMIRRLGRRIHFLHLRNVALDDPSLPGGSFHESEHLGGHVDMVAVVAEIVREEQRRKAEGRSDHQIPMRPDHGQDILDDLNRRAQPGYPTIGRMRGLAELRGIMSAFQHEGVGLPG